MADLTSGGESVHLDTSMFEKDGVSPSSKLTTSWKSKISKCLNKLGGNIFPRAASALPSPQPLDSSIRSRVDDLYDRHAGSGQDQFDHVDGELYGLAPKKKMKTGHEFVSNVSSPNLDLTRSSEERQQEHNLYTEEMDRRSERKQRDLLRRQEVEKLKQYEIEMELERQEQLEWYNERRGQNEEKRQAEMARQAEVMRIAERLAEMDRQDEMEKQADVSRRVKMERQLEIQRQAQFGRQLQIKKQLEMEKKVQFERQVERERLAEIDRIEQLRVKERMELERIEREQIVAMNRRRVEIKTRERELLRREQLQKNEFVNDSASEVCTSSLSDISVHDNQYVMDVAWKSPVVLFKHTNSINGQSLPLRGITGNQLAFFDSPLQSPYKEHGHVVYKTSTGSGPSLSYLKVKVKKPGKMSDFETDIASFNNRLMGMVMERDSLVKEGNRRKRLVWQERISALPVKKSQISPASQSTDVIQKTDLSHRNAKQKSKCSQDHTAVSSTGDGNAVPKLADQKPSLTDRKTTPTRTESPNKITGLKHNINGPNSPITKAAVSPVTTIPRWDISDESEEELLWEAEAVK